VVARYRSEGRGELGVVGWRDVGHAVLAAGAIAHPVAGGGDADHVVRACAADQLVMSSGSVRYANNCKGIGVA
jgi:hypothetical protein